MGGGEAAERTPGAKTADAAATVRPVSSADLPRIRELADQLGYPVTPQQLADWLEGLFGSPADGLFVAARGEAPPVGFIHVAASRALIHEPQAEIVSLVVDERVRGRRIGSALVAAAQDWACSRGFRILRVRCQIKREGAHRFYAREGFAHEKTQHVFTKTLSPQCKSQLRVESQTPDG